LSKALLLSKLLDIEIGYIEIMHNTYSSDIIINDLRSIVI